MERLPSVYLSCMELLALKRIVHVAAVGPSQQVSVALAALSAHHLAKVVLVIGTILLLEDELLFAASKVH